MQGICVPEFILLHCTAESNGWYDLVCRCVLGLREMQEHLRQQPALLPEILMLAVAGTTSVHGMVRCLSQWLCCNGFEEVCRQEDADVSGQPLVAEQHATSTVCGLYFFLCLQEMQEHLRQQPALLLLPEILRSSFEKKQLMFAVSVTVVCCAGDAGAPAAAAGAAAQDLAQLV
jgi:hypothetical protein